MNNSEASDLFYVDTSGASPDTQNCWVYISGFHSGILNFQDSKAVKNFWIFIFKALFEAFSFFWIALDIKFLRRRSNIAKLSCTTPAAFLFHFMHPVLKS